MIIALDQCAIVLKILFLHLFAIQVYVYKKFLYQNCLYSMIHSDSFQYNKILLFLVQYKRTSRKYMHNCIEEKKRPIGIANINSFVVTSRLRRSDVSMSQSKINDEVTFAKSFTMTLEAIGRDMRGSTKTQQETSNSTHRRVRHTSPRWRRHRIRRGTIRRR